MSQKSDPSTAALWARFRFSVVGSLLSAPPGKGQTKAALQSLAARIWTHPVSGEETRFALATIERWYYTARRAKDDPVGVLRRTVRKDCGKVSLTAEQIEHLRQQYEDHKHWTYQLHYDNLAAAVEAKPVMGRLRSYCTVRRYMQAHDLERKPRPGRRAAPANFWPPSGARAERSAATKPSTWARSGTSTSTTARGRCSPPLANGNGPSPWPSWTTIRGCAATCSGILGRPPRTSCMGFPRRSRNAACLARC